MPASAQTAGKENPASSSTKPASAHHHKSTAKRKAKKKKTAASWRNKGQQKPDVERTQAIQIALQREHYLSKEPSGVWDSDTQAAMERYQADHGWQSKSVPDSRALIKLGLGPGHEHLLNPESAMTTDTVSAVHPHPAPSASPTVAAAPPAAGTSTNQNSSPK